MLDLGGPALVYFLLSSLDINPLFFFPSPDPDAAAWLPDEFELMLSLLTLGAGFFVPNPFFRFL